MIPAGDRFSLPLPMTSLVGRDQELALVSGLLGRADVRLVTLTGPAGVGKTRLALELAANQPEERGGRVWFISLAGVTHPNGVLPAIARSVGVREFGDRPLADVLIAALRPRPGVLVIDNAEQVIDAAPDLAALLAACPGLKLLVTSREPLRLSGEHEVRIAPLAVPGDRRVMNDSEHPTAAVRLFVERARAAHPSFALTDDNQEAVGAICRQLDGLPLAIELAAAMTRAFSPAALWERLTASDIGALPVLANGPRDLPPRQQTLTSAIAWSYDLLCKPERAAFRALSVFNGGFTLTQAEQVLGAGGGPAAAPDISSLAVVSALVDKSLVIAYPQSYPARFCLLTTIRVFGWNLLTSSPNEGAIRRAHAELMLELAERWDETLFGPRYSEVTSQFDAEWCNFKAALDFATEERGAETLLAPLAGSLAQLWRLRGMHGEGTHWIDRALARGEATPPRTQARVLLGAGMLATMGCDYAAGLKSYEQALAIARALGDNLLAARILFHMLEAIASTGDEERALSLIAEARNLATGRDEALAALIEKALGELERRRGRLEQASAHLTAALTKMDEIGFTWGEADTHFALAATAHDQNDVQGAAQHLSACLVRYIQLHDWVGVANVAVAVSWLAADRDQARQAVRLYAGAGALYESLGLREPRHKYVAHQGWLAQLRTVIGGEADLVWDAGRAVTPELVATESAELAAAIGNATAASGAGSPAQRDGLSAREVEVLGWVAVGLTNAEVAERLFISPRTVNAHLTRIYHRLDLPSRAAAIRFAVDHGLVASEADRFGRQVHPN